MPDLEGLPGAELVGRGIEDRRAGRRTVAAFLVGLAPCRLTDLDLDLTSPIEWPADAEAALYLALGEDPTVDDVYYRYNSLRRELDSFIAALEARLRRARTALPG